MKISILGYSGSGKSTLAKSLGGLYDVPVLHLDYVHFLPNWEERTREEMSAIVQQFLDGNDAWVIDGTYSHNCFERRIQESDLVIFLDFNRVACFFRAWKRYRENKGRTRMDMAEGCIERFNGEFIRWLLRDGRTRKRRAIFQKVADRYAFKTVVIKNQRRLDALLHICKRGGVIKTKQGEFLAPTPKVRER